MFGVGLFKGGPCAAGTRVNISGPAGQIARSLISDLFSMKRVTPLSSVIVTVGLKKRPCDVIPARSSVIWLMPPDVVFWWHSRQDWALYTGPSPSGINSK